MQHRNRATAHMTLVAGALAAGLLVIVLGLTGCSCGGGKGTTTSKGSTGSTSNVGSGTATLEGQVGKPLAVGAVKITVTGLSAVAKPLLPRQVADPDAIPVSPGTGVVFYQAWVRVQNGGKSVVRVDPRDFSPHVRGQDLFSRPGALRPAGHEPDPHFFAGDSSSPSRCRPGRNRICCIAPLGMAGGS